jgi:replication-associated recombination protein RarA
LTTQGGSSILVTAMHAYLILGINKEEVRNKSEEIAQKIKAKVFPYPVAKIEDVRELNKLIRLSFNEPTLILMENIHQAGEAALNAFLKNLEEPQDNIYFALTAPNKQTMLPTIVSRCQVLKIQNSKSQIQNEGEIQEFLVMKSGQRLEFFGKIRDRDKAIEFIESLIFCLHEKRELTNMEALLTALKRLKANGNISLQLTNLLTNYA